MAEGEYLSLVEACSVGPAERWSWAVPVAASVADNTIRIGVLTDMSGPYKDLGGPNVVTCIRQAVQDFDASNRNIHVEVLFRRPSEQARCRKLDRTSVARP